MYLRKSMDINHNETTEINSTLDAELSRLRSSTVIKRLIFTAKKDQHLDGEHGHQNTYVCS